MSQDNRPALSRFNYRIGTYGSIREFLFHQLDKTPVLQRWTHRGSDDPAVALMEGASILGDILTFYQEAYANEAFLRTAEWRESVADLVRLLGYRLSPAVGGRGIFAFEIKKNEAVTIPARFPLKATLEQFDKPAEFETTETLTAYPWLSRFNLYRPLEDGDITPATTEFCVFQPEQLLYPVMFKPGERLLIGEANANWPAQPMELGHAEVVIVESVRDFHGTKIVKIKGHLTRVSAISSLAAYRIGRTFHHLGYNSPAQIVDPSEPVRSSATVSTGSGSAETETSSSIPYIDVPSSRPVKRPSGMFSDPTISRSIKTIEFPLDLELTDLPARLPIAIQARFAYPFLGEASRMFDPLPDVRTLVRTIEQIDTTTLTWGAVDGTVSEITVGQSLHDSIGDGDPATQALAERALTDAEEEMRNAVDTLKDGRAEANALKATAERLASEAARAEADIPLKASQAAAARSDVAVMVVAAEIAAAALKDNATDLATQAAVTAANAALSAAQDAKTKTATAATSAFTAQNRTNDADSASVDHRNVTRDVALAFLGGNPVADAAAFGAAGVLTAVSTAKGAVDTAKTNTDIAKTAVDLLPGLVDTAKASAEAARSAAGIDADAKERSRLANEALDEAKRAARRAADAEEKARSDAADAARDAANAATDAALAADRVKWLATYLAAAKRKAASKRIVSETRMYIKDALFHEVTSPLVTMRRAQQETTLQQGHTLTFKGTATEVAALKQRRIMLDRPGADPEVLSVVSLPATFDAATAGYPMLRPIDLSAAVSYADFPHHHPIVTVFGNLADATEGKTLAEIPIGSGDATQIFQSFKLTKSPLTYHLVAGNSPAETPQLSVYVDGREWTQVENFFNRGQDEWLYIVREDSDGNSWVQFGDGKTGSRLTNGVNNVTAVYRTGAGAHGALKPDTKVQASARLENLDRVSMPAEVTGGAPPEDTSNARNAAPANVQSLGRLVSLRDFEAEAVAIPGVASAAASWQLVDGIPAIEVTVLMDTGRGDELQAVAATLNAFNRQRGAGRDPVSVAAGKRLYVAVTVEYALGPTYRRENVEATIRRALGVNYASPTRDESDDGLFSLGRRRFGEREYASRIAGHVQNVEGVRWARTNRLTALTDDDDPALAQPSSSALDPIVACDSRHILSLFDRHLTLTAVMETGP